MRLLAGLGVETGVLPPQLRPHLALLEGAPLADAPLALLEKASSSSAMWVANAATVSPACDSADGLLHITAANLHTNLHRRIEAQATYHTLSQIFAQVPHAKLHPPLDASRGLYDEGAANHMRLSPTPSARGLHVFVHGKDARQSLAASQAVAVQHALDVRQVVFVQQHPEAIAAGVFHNDVIAVSHNRLLLAHEAAYVEGGLASIEAAWRALYPHEALNIITITQQELTLEEAVNTYFFNSQIVSAANGDTVVLAPIELTLLHGGKAARLMEKYFSDVRFLDLRQSMRNGGGPACLRLRVPMQHSQILALKNTVGVLVDEALLEGLEAMIECHYLDALTPEGLRDPALYKASQAVLTELSALLKLSLSPQ